MNTARQFFFEISPLLWATLAGALIGWEREWKAKPAGLRTHILVAIGSCAAMMAAMAYAQRVQYDGGVLRIDPLRVAQAIIGGVGFLGAGTIIQTRGTVEGITTAAGLWLVATLGVASALQAYEIFGAALVLGVVSLIILHWPERLLFPRKKAEEKE